MSNAPKIDRLLALTERLTEALLADIEALERYRPREMRSPSTEVQQMTALYTREASGLSPAVVKALPKDACERLTIATARFREVLGRHGSKLMRVRNATEGMIRAIAEDVAKRKTAQQPYAAAKPAKPSSPGAMIYNRVV